MAFSTHSVCDSQQVTSGQLQCLGNREDVFLCLSSSTWPFHSPCSDQVLSTGNQYLHLILLEFCNMHKWGGCDIGLEAINSYLLVI